MRDTRLPIQQGHDHRVHRPVGLRQEHGAAVPQPDERPGPRLPLRRPRALPRQGHLRPPVDPVAVRRHIGMVFQQPNPFAMSIYRNVAFGLRLNGYKGNMHAQVEQRPAQRGALGRGQGQAQQERPVALRRPAAAAVHRPGDRDRARGAADGRALLGARPDRHAQDRGADAGAEEALHDRHRHPQHAAGAAASPTRRPSSTWTPPRAAGPAISWSIGPTAADSSTTRARSLTQEYVSGQFS